MGGTSFKKERIFCSFLDITVFACGYLIGETKSPSKGVIPCPVWKLEVWKVSVNILDVYLCLPVN
jgi:hypothetical protein